MYNLAYLSNNALYIVEWIILLVLDSYCKVYYNIMKILIFMIFLQTYNVCQFMSLFLL